MVKSDNKDIYIECLGDIRGCLVAHCDCAKLCNEMTLAREKKCCKHLRWITHVECNGEYMCALGNKTSDEWCLKKERCCDYA